MLHKIHEVKDVAQDAVGKILRKMLHKMPMARFCERCYTRCRRQDSMKDVTQDAGGKIHEVKDVEQEAFG